MDSNQKIFVSDSTPTIPESEDGVSLIGFIRDIHRWRWMILCLTLSLTVITAVVLVFTPNRYTARGTVLLEMNESGLNFDMLGSLGSLAGLSSNASSADIYLAILQSRMVKETVIDSLELANYYEVKGDSREEVFEKTVFTLNDNIRFNSADQVTLTIDATDSDPEMAAAIANVFLDQLAHANQTLSLSRSHRTRKLIEKTLRETETELESARIRLGKFQSQYGVFSLEEQTRGTLTLIAQLQLKLLEAQTRKDTMAGVLRENSSEIRALDLSINALENQINRLVGRIGKQNDPGETTSDDAEPLNDKGSTHFILPLSEVPNLTGDYARIMMDLKVLETKYTVLATQLETTKIEESQSVPSFEILDRAQRPYTKSGPNRILGVLSALGIGLVVGVLMAFLLSESERRIDSKTREELLSMLPRSLYKR